MRITTTKIRPMKNPLRIRQSISMKPQTIKTPGMRQPTHIKGFGTGLPKIRMGGMKKL